MEKRLMTVVAGLALSTSMAFAQSQISGHVTSSEDGSPVIGASIKVAGTNTGTVTDIDGNFIERFLPEPSWRLHTSVCSLRQPRLLLT